MNAKRGGKPAGKDPRGPSAPPRACPCWSGRTYDACCAPYHRGEREAPDPVSLMRSRYAAFALGEAEYLVRTLAEGHPDQGLPRDDCRFQHQYEEEDGRDRK